MISWAWPQCQGLPISLRCSQVGRRAARWEQRSFLPVINSETVGLVLARTTDCIPRAASVSGFGVWGLSRCLNRWRNAVLRGTQRLFLPLTFTPVSHPLASESQGPTSNTAGRCTAGSTGLGPLFPALTLTSCMIQLCASVSPLVKWGPVIPTSFGAC